MSSKKGGKKDAGAPPSNAAYDALKGAWQTQAHEIIHERFPLKIVHLTRLLADSPLFSAARIASGGDEARAFARQLAAAISISTAATHTGAHCAFFRVEEVLFSFDSTGLCSGQLFSVGVPSTLLCAVSVSFFTQNLQCPKNDQGDNVIHVRSESCFEWHSC
jgi:hypothetical protein